MNISPRPFEDGPTPLRSNALSSLGPRMAHLTTPRAKVSVVARGSPDLNSICVFVPQHLRPLHRRWQHLHRSRRPLRSFREALQSAAASCFLRRTNFFAGWAASTLPGDRRVPARAPGVAGVLRGRRWRLGGKLPSLLGSRCKAVPQSLGGGSSSASWEVDARQFPTVRGRGLLSEPWTF